MFVLHLSTLQNGVECTCSAQWAKILAQSMSILSSIVLLQVIACCMVLLGVISLWPNTEAGQPFPPEAQFLTMTQFRKINPDIVSDLRQSSYTNTIFQGYRWGMQKLSEGDNFVSHPLIELLHINITQNSFLYN